MATSKAEWSPLKKWVVNVIGGVASGFILLVVVIDHNEAMQHRSKIETQLQTLEVEIKMRLQYLENVPLKSEFPSNQARLDIAIVKERLGNLGDEVKKLRHELQSHRHYAPTAPEYPYQP